MIAEMMNDVIFMSTSVSLCVERLIHVYQELAVKPRLTEKIATVNHH